MYILFKMYISGSVIYILYTIYIMYMYTFCVMYTKCIYTLCIFYTKCIVYCPCCSVHYVNRVYDNTYKFLYKKADKIIIKYVYLHLWKASKSTLLYT